MTSTPLGTPEDDDMIAAEYVLGTLDLSERLAAEARLRRDPAFAAMVDAWQERFADLNEDYAEAAAPNLLPQIEERLFPTPAKRRGDWLFGLIGLGASAAAALAVAAFFLLTPPSPSLVATLAADASPLRYAAAIAGDELTLTRVAGTDADPDKDYELWIIIGDNAPVSLGLLRADKTTIPAPAAEAGYILAITLEPKGGGPEGKPTGPIVAAGPLQNI
jgi:anti-sigma-K factor RskA